MVERRQSQHGGIGEPAQAETEAEQDGGDGDFAEEHNDLTVADEMTGGPEGQPEDDSPDGLAGAD